MEGLLSTGPTPSSFKGDPIEKLKREHDGDTHILPDSCSTQPASVKGEFPLGQGYFPS